MKADIKIKAKKAKLKRPRQKKAKDALVVRKFLNKDVWILPPQKRTLFFENYDGDLDDQDVYPSRKYQIPLPYLVFIKSGGGLHLVFANELPQDMECRVYFPALPNIHEHLLICQQNGRSTEESIANFFGSQFGGLDGGDAFPGHDVLEHIGGIQSWVRRKDATKIKWPLYTTLGALLRRLPNSPPWIAVSNYSDSGQFFEYIEFEDELEDEDSDEDAEEHNTCWYKDD